MPFPEIDPVIFQIGPFALRWYALAYIVGLVGGWYHILSLASHSPVLKTEEDKARLDHLLVWLTLGTILGGRLGYVLFYNPGHYIDNPGEILAVWKGGMAFHGGLLGVLLAGWLYAVRNSVSPLALGDLVAASAPIGLFFGRISNFINSELWGRTTDSALGVVFPNGGPLPRHPSQLYEALLEGLILFALISYLCRRTDALKRPGLVIGVFLSGYGLSRMAVEQFFREPDAHIGFFIWGTTMGFWLSLPMLLAGLGVIFYARRKTATDE